MVSLGIVYNSFNGKSFAAMCGTKGIKALYLRTHAPPRACTSFPLSGRQLSKNQTPAAISTRLLRALLPKPLDVSLGESWPRGAMKWKRPEQRRENRRGRRRWCLAAVALWFRRLRIKLLTPSQSLASRNRSSTRVLFLSSCSLCSILHSQSFYRTVNAEPHVSKHHTRKIER